MLNPRSLSTSSASSPNSSEVSPNPKPQSQTTQHYATQNQAILLGLVSVTAFALTLPFAKIAVTHLSGVQVGLLRSLLAGVVAVAILGVTKSAFPNFSQIKRLYSGSLGIIYGFPIFSAMGMQSVPVGHGAVVLALLPMTTAIFGVILTGRTMPIKFWLWSLAGVLTVLAYVGHSFSQKGSLGTGLYVGDMYLGLAMVLAGFGYAQSGQLASERKGWEVMCWMLVLNLPIVAVLSLWMVDFPTLGLLIAQGNVKEIGAVLFLAWVSSLLGFFSWNKALAMGGIAKISQLQLLQTFITYVVAVLFMGESWDIFAIMTGIITIGIVYFTQKVARQTK